MFLSSFHFLALTIIGVYTRELKHPECRINYDKYDRQALASNRNMAQGEKWPQREVPYVIRSTFTSSETNVIKSAIAEVESKTCLKWIPRTNQINYVDINHDRAGCFAALGYNRNRGRHILNLEKFNGVTNCVSKGVCIHEMLHILGFAHEHTRPDRDQYVKVHWERITTNTISNFFRAIDIKQTIIPPVCEFTPGKTTYDDCYSGFKTNTFGISYDYGSIMHYPLTDFSIAGEPTMDILKTVPQGVTIGNRISMTDLDAAKVKARYECHKSLEETTTRKPSVECRDIYVECPTLKSFCNNTFIKEGCPVSCGSCEACFDNFSNCPDFAGLCGENDEITKNCHFTCRTC